MADSEEKLCRLVSEFGRGCERRKFRVNVGKSKVMRCSKYGNVGRMHVILNGELLVSLLKVRRLVSLLKIKWIVLSTWAASGS